jgi:LPXTG-motif cell wall-anchored protein
MQKFKAKGEAAYKACVAKEEAAPITTQAISAEEVRKAVGGGGAQQTGESTSPLVYVLGASVLAVGGFVVYAMVKKNKQKKGAA